VAALLATGLLHLLLASTPRPLQFFTWIVALATVAAELNATLWERRAHRLRLNTPPP
jgi:hypothetical protein